MAAITPVSICSEHVEPPVGKRVTALTGRHGLILVILATAMWTLFSAYPRLCANLTYTPVQAALSSQWRGQEIPIEQIPRLVETTQSAIGYSSNARYWRGLGWLYYHAALRQGVDSPEGRDALDDSLRAFRTSLTTSPVSPAVWLRIAWIQSLLGHDGDTVLATLEMSFYTGRTERHLMINRLELCLLHARALSDDYKRLVNDQIVLSWRFFKHDLLRLIGGNLRHRIAVFELLGEFDPELLSVVEKWLEKTS